ncbi:phage tail protein [Methylovulum psychrotolerans]|jgi:microcystin-dependent protein|uniref:phage tail protein n=1 Tax=Methylovulum psychrotolerans TaxID=1704499 RepID=UPI001BFF3375|nr:tail fiber protein [Methylovulum psychrotolerans]MBT9097285.1 phage tail protein [Methylovulum psychrotolerans]
MSEPFVGEIRMVGFNYAPRGWALCDGHTLPVAQYQALFALLGVTYGGDGRTTFGLPDLRGRVPVNQGTGPGLSTYVMGQKAGSETVTLTSAQIPNHTHSLNVSSSQGTLATPVNNFLAVPVDNNGTANMQDFAPTANATMNAAAIGATGGNQAHTNIQPYLCVNFIIALNGIFPSRN